jgi:hypothetical protein
MKFYWPFALLAVLAAGCGSATTPAVTTAHHGPTTTTAHHGPATAAPGHRVPPSVIRRLTALANRAVKADDGRGVAWATVVVTTRQKALTSATPGDLVPNDQRTVVYLITIKGHFVARDASVPPGARAPRGRYLSMVIGAKTSFGLDEGLSPKAPPVDPASLGPVTHLKIRR